jgi:DNA-binding MarR family transcriptional regulator
MADGDGEIVTHEAADDAGEPIVFGRGFMLWQVANGWQRAARSVLAPTGLTYVQTLLLAGLAEQLETDGRITQAGLAQALGADAMMTSQVLRTLEAAGLVRRERDPSDTRARNVALTGEGARKLHEVRPLLAQIDESFFDPLGKKEKRFVKSLKKLWRTQRADEPPRNGKDKDD